MSIEETLRAHLPAPLFAAARRVYNSRPSAVRARRGHRLDTRAGRAVAEAAGWTVARGPFRGMTYVEAYGDLGAKVLGSYEEELHETVEELIAADYGTIINVGAAEGYYAVGMAMRCPDARVIAYETSPRGQALCTQMARLNDVQVDVRGTFTAQDLTTVGDDRVLVVMDIEGGELPLLDPAVEPALAEADHLVELHDFVDPSITPTILERFRGTHDARIIRTRDRRPADYPELTAATARVLDEHRPCPMEWALLTKR
ncbi:hypothetical protein ACTHQ1_06170 [Janibacter anophelis]|uniref:hypothetical protein n=1 Tax=Janibacter anophelis TaxID=319054 RepID=UPI003F8217E9